LGIFVSDASVGVYAAAEKVIKAVQSVVSPIAQALFPHLGSRFKTGTIKDNIRILLNIVKKLAVVLLILSVLTLFFAPLIAKFIGGKELIYATPLIRTMSMVIFFGGLNYLLGIVGLINFNRQKDFFVYVMLAGVFSIVFLLLTVQQLDNLAAAIAMLLSEILLFVGCGYGIYRLYHHNKKG
jgi:PST family polysaccharide transporter